jgi:dihydroxyacetone kinase
MTTSSKKQTKKKLRLDQKAHEAQAKADKLQRKALDNGKVKKAQKAQGKADRMLDEASIGSPDAVEE